MKKRITIAAYLAGATTLAVTLPAMADSRDVGAPTTVQSQTDKADTPSKS